MILNCLFLSVLLFPISVLSRTIAILSSADVAPVVYIIPGSSLLADLISGPLLVVCCLTDLCTVGRASCGPVFLSHLLPLSLPFSLLPLSFSLFFVDRRSLLLRVFLAIISTLARLLWEIIWLVDSNILVDLFQMWVFGMLLDLFSPMERVNPRVVDHDDSPCLHHFQRIHNCYGQSCLVSSLELYLALLSLAQSELFLHLYDLQGNIEVSLCVIDFIDLDDG